MPQVAFSSVHEVLAQLSHCPVFALQTSGAVHDPQFVTGTPQASTAVPHSIPAVAQ